MKANDESLTKLINGVVQFVIPVFQRDYTWTEEQCQQLWNDVITVASGGPQAKHFIGSIVYTPTEGGSAVFTRWLLIDGQQRLTTVMLLLAALRDHLSESAWQGDEPSPRLLDRQLLRNHDEIERRRLKLVLRRHDDDTLRAILDGDELPDQPSERIQENYEYLKELIANQDPRVVYRGIGRLEIVDVRLEGGDDPQLIFESLNSTGVELSQSDLIRNFILMGLTVSEQDRLYMRFWHRIEILFRGHEPLFDSFARDYVALTTQARKQGRADDVYRDFRHVFPQFVGAGGSLDEALAEMLRFARYYVAFRLGREAPDGLAGPLRRLRRLVDAPAILVMVLFDYYNRAGTLARHDFRRALWLLESYVMRRAVCGLQTRGYWPVFATVAYRTEEHRPLDSLKVGLARLSDTYRFPNDQEFQSHLQRQHLYGKRVCRLILERLENHGAKERTETQSYSIEHIMPQNERLRPEWREMLGRDKWRDIQSEWLHRLGNLTLTGYNPEYSDRPFVEKKACRGGFEDSAVRLNKFVREQSVWTEVQMEERSFLLAARAVDAWPTLKVRPELLEEARKADLNERAAARSVDQVKMSETARSLATLVGDRTRALDSRIVEVAEGSSVSYHAPDFFMEVLPRKYGLMLLLSPEVNEIEDHHGVAMDATQWKYFRGSRYKGGVAVNVGASDDLDHAMALVRQAFVICAG